MMYTLAGSLADSIPSPPRGEGQGEGNSIKSCILITPFMPGQSQ